MNPFGGFPGGQSAGQKGTKARPANGTQTLVRLVRYVVDKPWQLLFAGLLVLGSVLASIGQTYLLKPIFDRMAKAVGENQHILSVIFVPVALLALLYIVEAAAAYLQSVMMAKLALNGCNKLRFQLFSHMQRLPASTLDRYSRGELMSRLIHDTDSLQQMLESSIVNLVQGSVTFVGTMAVMLLLSPRLFLVTLLMTGATALLFRSMGGRSHQMFRSRQTALGQLNAAVQETIQGIKTVKAFHHEEEAKQQFEDINRGFQTAAQRATFYSSGIRPVASNLSNSGYVLTAVYGCFLALRGLVGVGDLAAYLNFTRKVASPINQISQQFTSILSALAGAERIFSILDLPQEENNGPVAIVSARRTPEGILVPQQNGPISVWKIGDQLREVRGEIEFRNVSFSYQPGKPVLRDVSFRAEAGSRIALVGPTGAGKTSIVNLIDRFYQPDSGSILCDGIDLAQIDTEVLRGITGVVLQDTHLFTGSVMDNIRFGAPSASDESCILAAKSIHVHSFITHLPQGYDTQLSDEGDLLSAGQRQLLAITRVAVANPRIVILDEATSSVDIQTEQLITQGMSRLMASRTAFVVAHRLSTVRDADRILFIEDGRIAEQGTHEQLILLGGRYAKLCKDAESDWNEVSN